MDDLATNLLATLKKPSASIESKIQLFNTLKSKIKHEQVPESAQATTVECVRIAIASQISSSLVSTGFSTLSHLIKRLSLQEQMNVLFSKRVDLLTLLLERLGDQKEAHRTAALQALCDLWPARQMEVEKIIRDDALLGNNVRTKEMGLQWVTKMHFEQGLQFRTFVPPMVACLEDADGMIRDSAKTNIVELFRSARDAAKADLKRQLTAYNVRKSIASYIMSQLQIPGANGAAAGRPETPSLDQGTAAETAVPAAPSLPPSAEATNIEPYYVHTVRDLEDEFRKMAPAFEGKESEENWKARDANVLKIRRMLKGNAPGEHTVAFIMGIKGLLDGILKVVKSLRTTMSVNGCNCIQELARTLGPGLDPMVEIILQAVDPLCASTKNIAAQNGNATVDTVLSNVSYHVRLMQHVWNSCNDKNVQPKIFAAGWLKSILKAQSAHKGHFEHTGGLELAEKCIKKGLSDPNPKVRESMRSVYWTFAQIWVDRGAIIMENLDAKSKSLLEKDPSNPNRPGGGSSLTSSVGPGGAPNPRAAAPRTTLKDTIAAQKKAALAAKKVPDRPNSAMSAFTSPVKASQPPNRPPTGMSQNRTTSGMSSHAPSRPVTTKPTSSTTTTASQNSLMSGPIRRPRRPDVPRPATADPYANRKIAGETPRESPVGSPRLYAKGSVSNMRSSHAKSKSTTTARIVESGRTSRAESPKISPVRVKEHPEDAHFHSHLPRPSIGHSSPVSKDESLTMVLPESHFARRTPFGGNHRNSIDRPGSSHSPLNLKNSGATAAPNGESAIKSPSGAISMSPPKTETPIRNLRHQRTKSNDMLRGMSEEPPSVGQSKSKRRDSANVKSISPNELNGNERNGNVMHVYEDPSNENHESPSAEVRDEVVLEELPLNEQTQQVQPVTSPSLEQATPGISERRLSSAKKPVTTYVDRLQDHADILKTRRQLTGGTKQIRTKESDAHVFRKLQELVKGHIQNPEVRFADLLTALLEYLETPGEELKVSSTKAHGLKLQALTTTRAILVLHHRDEDVRKLYSQALCAMVVAKSLSEPASHTSSDVDKAIDEVLQYLEDRLDECIDAVSSLAETESQKAESSHGIVSGSLKVLSKLVSHSRDRNEEVNMLRRRRLGSLAVQFLGHSDSDVRKADTEFCIELYQLFGDSHKREFWNLLEAAPESQQNLVAYYITRKGKSRG